MTPLSHLLALIQSEYQRRSHTQTLHYRELLPSPILGFYDMVKERYGPEAVVPIVNSACSGCHIKVPRYDLKQLDENIFVCEHCNRILYDPEQVATGELHLI